MSEINKEQVESQGLPGISTKEFVEFLMKQTGKSGEEVACLILNMYQADKELSLQAADSGDALTVADPYKTLIHSILTLGWGLVVDQDATEIEGLVIGTPDYIAGKIPSAGEALEELQERIKKDQEV
jgi:hypothetical protein